VRRLIALVRSRLKHKYRRRFDSEDVVQAAMASFFGRMKNDEFSFEHNGQLWHLLAAIAMNKLRERLRYENAQRRGVDREQAPIESAMGSINGIPVEELLGEPSDAEECELREEVERVLEDYSPKQRYVITLCLQGCSVKEIAEEARVSAANARRILRDFKEDLATRLHSSFAQ
jgi:RNA polymerase sigma factor (sigma-70 family)